MRLKSFLFAMFCQRLVVFSLLVAAGNASISAGAAVPAADLEKIRECREVLLQGNRLGQHALPATHIQIQDQATRNSLREQ
jgi:cellobiose-specific phosphotransferase system component IIA